MDKIICKNKVQAYLHKTNSNLCGFSIWFKVGSMYDTKQKQGLVHLIEHLKFTNGKEFEKIGITLHAFTSMDYMEITGSFLASDDVICIKHIVDIINKQIVITKDVLKKEIKTILNEKKESQNNTYQKMWQIRNSQLWQGNSLANDFFGTKQTLSNITQLDINNFNDTYLQNSKNMVLFFNGNLQKTKLQTILNNIVIKNSKEVHAKLGTSNSIKQNKTVQFTNNAIGIHIKVPNINKQDTIKLHVLREILANNWSSVFVEEMRTNKNQTYWVDSSSSIFIKDGYISTIFEPKDTDLHSLVNKAKDILLNLEKYITDDRLTAIKKSYTLRILANNYSPQDMCYWYGESFIKDGAIYSPEEYVKKVNNTQATDIKKFIKTVITPKTIFSTILKQN